MLNLSSPAVFLGLALVSLAQPTAATTIAPRVDIKVGACPNVLSIKGVGRVSVALFGSDALDVSLVELASVRLARVDGFDTLGAALVPDAIIGSGVAPVASEFGQLPDAFANEDELGGCKAQSADGRLDLLFQFKMTDVVPFMQLSSLAGGAIVPVGLTGKLVTGERFSSLASPDFITLVVPRAPVVHIFSGSDVTVTAPASLSLDARASARPSVTSYHWCQVRGLGEATFDDDTTPSTNVTFNTAGDYLLVLTASNGELSGEATVRVRVNLAPNGPKSPAEIEAIVSKTAPALEHNRFLIKVSNDDVTAAAYYAAIDPQQKKTTFQQWLNENGMTDANVTVASYFNALDLGFGRRMVMSDNGRAFVVTNYRTADDAAGNVNPIAAVAMEADPFTKFYVYKFKADGSTERALSADLDGGGEKSVPGLCIVCHGGVNNGSVALGQAYPQGGDVKARFLPFDVTAFQYSCRQGLTRSDLEDEFKELNSAVLAIEEDIIGQDNQSALTELIEGWYGGSALPRATQDTSFVPALWQDDTSTTILSVTDQIGLYRSVVAPSCRGCHSVRQSPLLRFGRFQDFHVFRGSVKADVLDAMSMPQARKTFERFWKNTAPETSLEVLDEYLKSHP